MDEKQTKRGVFEGNLSKESGSTDANTPAVHPKGYFSIFRADKYPQKNRLASVIKWT